MILATKPYHCPWHLLGAGPPPLCTMVNSVFRNEVGNSVLRNVLPTGKSEQSWVRRSPVCVCVCVCVCDRSPSEPLPCSYAWGPPGITVGVLFRGCGQLCGLWSQVPGFKSWFPTTSLLYDPGLLIKLSVLQPPHL